METLKVVTEQEITTTTTTTIEEKYKVLAPESMQETFMSDSEDEGGKSLIFYLFLHSIFYFFYFTFNFSLQSYRVNPYLNLMLLELKTDADKKIVHERSSKTLL